MPYVICDKCGRRRLWYKSRGRLVDYRTKCCDSTAHIPKKPAKPSPPPKPSILASYEAGIHTTEGGLRWIRQTAKIVLTGSRKIKVQRNVYLEPTATVREGYRYFECTGNCGLSDVDCHALHRAKVREEDWQKLLRS